MQHQQGLEYSFQLSLHVLTKGTADSCWANMSTIRDQFFDHLWQIYLQSKSARPLAVPNCSCHPMLVGKLNKRNVASTYSQECHGVGENVASRAFRDQ